MSKKVIGITVGRKFENYLGWLEQSSDIEIIRLNHRDKNFEAIKDCHGLVLTGGEDVHPRFYNKPEYITEYRLDAPDEARDVFDLSLLSYARHHRLPVLGICRGLQVANVFFGGTLIPDITSFDKPDHAKFSEGNDRVHHVTVVKGSFLEKIAGASGEVNSAHHQAVDVLAPGLRINAQSDDGVIEGLEWEDREGKPFLMLVQWHPERMPDQHSVFSKNIRERFIKSVR